MIEKKLPPINFIGNKEKISSWLCAHFPKDSNSVFDVFSGGSSVGYLAKTKGYRVVSNDIQVTNYLIAKALIENRDVKLNQDDIEMIFSGKPFKGFMFKNYSNKIFFPDECMQLDQYRKNIEKINCDYKKAIAFTLMRRAMIRKMPYSRFNIKWEKVTQLRDESYSYEKYKRKRAYHNKSFKFHFIDNLDKYQNAIFNNGQSNVAYNQDAFSLLDKVEAEIVYLDPPYSGTMSNYYGFYNAIDEYVLQKKNLPFANNFLNKATTIELFDKMFANLNKYKYWYLSYNNNSYPDKETLVKMIKQYANKVDVVEKKHNYKITGKRTKNKNTEFLFIAER